MRRDMFTRRGFGIATLSTALSAKKPPRRPAMTTTAPSSLRATVTANGVNAGDQVSVLVDGADTAVTANGLAGYLPVTGDRLLVSRVGSQVEVIQFLAKSMIVGQTVKTAPSGNRWEISSGTDPSFPDTIKGFTGGANEVEPALIQAGYAVFGGTDDEAYMEVVSPSVTATYNPAGIIFGAQMVSGTFINIHGDRVTIDGPCKIGQASSAIAGIAFGSTTVTLTAQANASVVVPHSLGATPSAVLLTVGGGKSQYYPWHAGLSSTQFSVGVTQRAGTVVTDSVPVSWVAIR